MESRLQVCVGWDIRGRCQRILFGKCGADGAGPKTGGGPRAGSAEGRDWLVSTGKEGYFRRFSHWWRWRWGIVLRLMETNSCTHSSFCVLSFFVAESNFSMDEESEI